MTHTQMEQEEQAVTAVRDVLAAFQAGYVARDAAKLEPFMALFAADCELIGTNGWQPGKGEWCRDPQTIRQVIAADWADWGDVRVDVPGARIGVNGRTAWLSTPGVVLRELEPAQSYANFMSYVKWVTENEPEVPPQEKLLDLLQGGTLTLAQAEQGAAYVWPFRFTAVLQQAADDRWQFVQMAFSFPTIYPPDIRHTQPPAWLADAA